MMDFILRSISWGEGQLETNLMHKYLIPAITLLAGCSLAPVDASPEARRWATDLGYNVQGVSCAGRDSDADGYVSCTVKPVDQDPVSIECNYVFGGGCKIVQANTLKVRR